MTVLSVVSWSRSRSTVSERGGGGDGGTTSQFRPRPPRWQSLAGARAGHLLPQRGTNQLQNGVVPSRADSARRAVHPTVDPQLHLATSAPVHDTRRRRRQGQGQLRRTSLRQSSRWRRGPFQLCHLNSEPRVLGSTHPGGCLEEPDARLTCGELIEARLSGCGLRPVPMPRSCARS